MVIWNWWQPAGMRRLLLVCLLLFGTLPACTVQPVPAQKLADVKTIAVVSALGDEITFQHVGFTVFTNDRQTSHVDWKLDDFATQEIAAMLAGRFEVRTVNYDRAKFREHSDQGLWGEWASSNALLKQTAKSGEVDAYCIVRTRNWPDAIARSNQEISGIGLYSRGGLFASGLIVASYASYQIEIIDGRTFATIAAVPGTLPRPAPVGIPFSSLGPSIDTLPFKDSTVPWAARLEAMPHEQQEQLHQALLKLLDDSLRYTLTKMALTAVPAK